MSHHIKIHEQVLSPAFCAAAIARFDADKRVKPDPQPDYSTRRYLSLSRCVDWLSVSSELCRHANRLMADYFARPAELAAATHHEWTDDGYVMACYDVGDSLIMHVDGQCAVEPNNGLRLATVLFYLNDVPEGGETYFPLQEIKIAPKAGRAVVFPVGFTHPHSVLTTKSPRYIIQTWITDPHMVVVQRPEEDD